MTSNYLMKIAAVNLFATQREIAIDCKIEPGYDRIGKGPYKFSLTADQAESLAHELIEAASKLRSV